MLCNGLSHSVQLTGRFFALLCEIGANVLLQSKESSCFGGGFVVLFCLFFLDWSDMFRLSFSLVRPKLTKSLFLLQNTGMTQV